MNIAIIYILTINIKFKDNELRSYKMGDVNELKVMINRVLLPRIRQLENEVSSLRKHTWPYVQARKEHNELDDMEAKIQFFKNLDDETIKELLEIKSRLRRGSNLQHREFDMITFRNLENNFC
jgi:hypothetical protein|tara:strand:- start:26 stop:394 length:369 start_codon:yes stop_codon:yes gene_type:complete